MTHVRGLTCYPVLLCDNNQPGFNSLYSNEFQWPFLFGKHPTVSIIDKKMFFCNSLLISVC